MDEQGIHIEKTVELSYPLLIAGFDGWGNALNVSKGMVSYLVRSLNAEIFARINPDHFYRYDEDRPGVKIEDGLLKQFSTPGGAFYAAKTGQAERDLVILMADEPHLNWFNFIDGLFSLCQQHGIKTIITLGSMYDNVLHTDRIVSGIVSDPELFSRLKEKNVIPINYQGPSAIHSIIQSQGSQQGFHCISLWGHCPFYLQGTIHFGLMAHLGKMLSHFGEFTLDTQTLEASWQELDKQIRELVNRNPEVQSIISELRKAKVRGSWESMKGSAKKSDKVINLTDFLKPG
ncbi:MAG: PAC2 family protein [Thermodesulfobacteriota bacterium]|nr:PAC2 family protein [Thermodesulfobacteriota bacterium]